MIKCPFCGNLFSAAAAANPAGDQPLRPPPPPPFAVGVDQQQVVDNEHIRLLSIFHFVVAGLAVCGVGFLFLHYLIMSSVLSDPGVFFKGQPNAPHLPKDFFKFFIWFYVIMGVILATAAVGNLLSGIFLRQKKNRIFSIMIGALNCLQIPLGTVLGIFTIIVLSRDSVRKDYRG